MGRRHRRTRLGDLTPLVSRDISITWLQLGKEERKFRGCFYPSSPWREGAEVVNSKAFRALPEERDRTVSGSVCVLGCGAKVSEGVPALPHRPELLCAVM